MTGNILPPHKSCNDCPVLAYANEIPQHPTPHFPCGPCPLIDEISAQIDLYRIALLHLAIPSNGNYHIGQVAEYTAEVKLIRQFILDLESLYNLANATLTETSIKETPE